MFAVCIVAYTLDLAFHPGYLGDLISWLVFENGPRVSSHSDGSTSAGPR